MHTGLVLLGVCGLLLLVTGLLISIYPIKSRVFRQRKRITAEALAESRLFGLLTGWITRNENSGIYRASRSLLRKAESGMKVRTLYFYKLVCLVTVTLVLLTVRYTNIDVMKISIISKSAVDINLFETARARDYKYNFALYKAVLARIGEKNMERMDESRKLETVKSALADEMAEENREVVEERAKAIVRTYNNVNGLRVLDLKTAALILVSFFLPEVMLLLRRLLLSSKYRNEVVKLENIFELLGSIRGFKTIYILKEMSNAAKACSKQLKRCVGDFQADREQALENLRSSVQNRRFSKLVDVIRVYSMVDKAVAMEILERNKLEKEEEMLLTAEEDVDIVDVIAFVSVTPIIFELGNLLMKPMLDMVFQAFNVF